MNIDKNIGGMKMTMDEVKEVIQKLRKDGNSDDEILYSFSRLYFDDKIDLEAFDALVNILGYHLDDKFKKLSKKEQFKWFKGER